MCVEKKTGIKKTACFLLLTFFLMFSGQAFSCAIPVYRYALEFWEPDPYRVTVFFDGSFDPSEQSLYDELHERSMNNASPVNISVNRVDLASDPRALDRLDGLSGSSLELPLMVVQFPFISGKNRVVWSVPFNHENVQLLLDSPVRRESAQRLAGGEMTWILLESGSRSLDNEAYQTLRRELNRLEQTLELPDPELWWTGRSEEDRPVISFDIIRVSKNNPEETFLVQMLLHSEDDLMELASQPMAFPLYGRGIALWAIVGSGINSWNITDAAEFLTGPCSCQVKMLNPGVDLLYSMDWDSSVEMISDDMLTPVAGFSEFEVRGEYLERRLDEQFVPEAGDGHMEGDQGYGADASGRDLRTSDRESRQTADLPAASAEQYAAELDQTMAADRPAGTGSRQDGRQERGISTLLLAVMFGLMIVVLAGGIILFRVTGRESG